MGELFGQGFNSPRLHHIKISAAKTAEEKEMKAFGLFLTGLLFTALFGALHMEMLDDVILQLPETAQSLLLIWVVEGNSITAQFISLAAMLVGLFSIRFKKKEPLF
jgi:hypothetical protein